MTEIPMGEHLKPLDEKLKIISEFTQEGRLRPVKKREPIEETTESVSYLGVRLPKAEVTDSPFVPKRAQYEGFINDGFALDLQRNIAVSWLQGEPVLIEGGTSIGKTTAVRKMAADLGYEVHYANLNGATDVEDLMGRYIPNPNKRTPDDPEYVFADGKVTSGLRVEEGKRKVVILDEFNSAAPNILIRLHEVLDALSRGESVVLAEDASETVPTDKETTKVVALMNPPGKGYFGREPLDPAQLRRWVYHKAPTELPPQTFSHSTDALFGLAPQTEENALLTYLDSRDVVLPPTELEQIPGITEILAKYKEFHAGMKQMVAQRRVAADQPQPFTFDDRMEPRRVRDFILRFYNGDISDTFQKALRYYYANKLESAVEKSQVEELIAHVEYHQEESVSQRRGLDREEDNTEISQDVLGSTPKERMSISFDEASRIMDSNYFGPEAVGKLLGISVRSERFPLIPFSKEELEQAKRLGQMLVLRADKAPDGTPLTMQRLQTLLQKKFDAEKKGKVLYNTDWYKDETFFTGEAPERGWALVGGQVLPDSTSKNYLEQTRVLADYLVNEAFKGIPFPAIYSKAVSEFYRQIDTIEGLMSSDWQEAAKQLSALQINQLTRQTPAEALYDMLLQTQNKKETDKRLLEDNYTWTNERSSAGDLVLMGSFDSRGAVVNGSVPDDSTSRLGVVFSRHL